MSSRAPVAGVVLALLIMLAAGAPAPVAGAPTDSLEKCTEVKNTAFRDSNTTISEVNQSGSASVTVQNTQATLERTDTEQAGGFIRLSFTNPNGYCVRLTLQISEEVAPAAEMGTIESLEGDHSAEWHAMQDLESGERYTEVVVDLPAGSSGITFAPNKQHLEVLSWTSGATARGGSALSKLKSAVGISSPELEQREYTLAPGANRSVTVPLKASDGREVEEYHAVYRQSADERWQPVQTDTEAPVYKTEKGSSVQFVFNENATVEFTANPTWRDDFENEWREYSAGWEEILGFENPLSLHYGGGIA